MSRPDWTPSRFDIHWNAFCDADHGDYPENFIEACEEDGLAELVPVTDEALQESFAAERGIYPGGSMWVLTKAGNETFDRARSHRARADKTAASVDTHPKDGDVEQTPLVSGAVPKADAHD